MPAAGWSGSLRRWASWSNCCRPGGSMPVTGYGNLWRSMTNHQTINLDRTLKTLKRFCGQCADSGAKVTMRARMSEAARSIEGVDRSERRSSRPADRAARVVAGGRGIVGCSATWRSQPRCFGSGSDSGAGPARSGRAAGRPADRARFDAAGRRDGGGDTPQAARATVLPPSLRPISEISEKIRPASPALRGGWAW